MRVAIVGCGQISRMHIDALREINGVEICAVCDRDLWRARKASEICPGAQVYTDTTTMLQESKPQAVHVLTPPDSHAELSILAMEAGCHVLVEKPMAVNVRQADRMIQTATANGVRLCTNHNYLYKPSMMKARATVDNGEIGSVTHVDSYYGFAGSAYLDVKGQSHWAWNLPGGVFTNFVPHLIYLQLEFLHEIESVAGIVVSGADKHGQQPSELAVLLKGANASGSMVISMRTKPYARFVNVYGTKGMVHADLVGEVCTIHRDRRVPRMVSKALFNLEESLQLAYGTASSTLNVGLGRLKNMPGLRYLLDEFYASIAEDREPPAPGQMGRKMVAVLEQISAQAKRRGTSSTLVPVASDHVGPLTEAETSFASNRPQGRVLITGATGFLGSRLVSALSRCGADVVALVRDVNSVSENLRRQTRLVHGDLCDPASVAAAMSGVELVYHCAAVTANNTPWTMHNEVNVHGTEAILREALRAGVGRVVHISSVVVYGLEGFGRNGYLDESMPYAQKPDKWAYYLRSKLEADKIAARYSVETDLPVTILRLGILYGPGGRGVGRGLMQFGPVRLTIGTGRNSLPFTYVGNAVDCLLLAGISAEAAGEAYNVVDEPQISVRQAALMNSELAGEKLILLPVPVPLLKPIARMLQYRADVSGSTVPPKFTDYVIRSASRHLQYGTHKAREQLSWRSTVSLEEGLRTSHGQ